MKSSVSIVKCQNYDEDKVLSGLRRSIDLIGGIQTFVREDNHVLLKPNLLFGKSPEKAVTTHPSILRGMIQIVREAGGIPFIGDSPSVGSLVKTAEKAGIKAVADEMKCPLVEFNKPVLPPKRKGKIFKQLEIDQTVLEVDVIINLPKFKTHSLTLLTLGVKNLFGCIPGPRKALWHLKAGEDRKTFAQILVDVYQIIHPSLTILDGIVGMEGNGPNSGQPIPLGLILASGDSLSLDQIVCDLLGVSRESLLTNRVAFEQGLGKDGIEVVGEKVEDVRIPHFQFPTLSQPDWNLPGFLRRALKNALTSKPVVQEEICNACDRCSEICPPKALARKGKDLVFDYEQCIRCFCCLEVCPEGAISIKPGWALKLVSRKSKVESGKSLI
ncbi:MAG: DUF362 domain-containing protein [Thermodesulfobacteriota bacterium]|jgi:uncharacterized protein (DUF362 family)/Pyruvate/2-oxoacid:ferredoxin oxidoreductase delta subunit